MDDALSRHVPHTEAKLETESAAVGEDEARTARATFAALDETQDHKSHAIDDLNCSAPERCELSRMLETLRDGDVIDTAAFTVVPADGSRGACQFETIAAAQGDGTSADGLRAAVSAFILRRPDARVQYGAQLISIAELT